MSPPKLIEKTFKGPRQFLEWATFAPEQWEQTKCQSRFTDSKTKEFTLCENYDEAYDLALYGWPEGLKHLTRELETVRNIHTPWRQNHIKYDVAGEKPHIPRAAAGDIFNMQNRGREREKRPPVLHTRLQLVYSCYQEPENIIRWGALLISYLDQLEQLRISTDIEAVFEAIPDDKSTPMLSFRFPLKQAGVPLNLNLFVFWLAHPSAARRIGFSAVERLDVQRFYEHNYGYPRSVTKIPENTVFFSLNDDLRNTMSENVHVISGKIISLRPDLESYLPSFSKDPQPTPAITA